MKMTDILKKYVLPNLPYLIFLWFFAKVGEAVRLAPGVDAFHKAAGAGGWFYSGLSDFYARARRF